MSKIITGKEALIALANGEDVETRNKTTGSDWHNAMTLNLFSFRSSTFEFRLKPRTITINGVDINAPEKNDDPDLELLEFGQEYWLVDLANYPDFVIPHKWKFLSCLHGSEQ